MKAFLLKALVVLAVLALLALGVIGYFVRSSVTEAILIGVAVGLVIAVGVTLRARASHSAQDGADRAPREATRRKRKNGTSLLVAVVALGALVGIGFAVVPTHESAVPPPNQRVIETMRIRVTGRASFDREK